MFDGGYASVYLAPQSSRSGETVILLQCFLNAETVPNLDRVTSRKAPPSNRSAVPSGTGTPIHNHTSHAMLALRHDRAFMLVTTDGATMSAHSQHSLGAGHTRLPRLELAQRRWHAESLRNA